jgi:hypothetical protein
MKSAKIENSTIITKTKNIQNNTAYNRNINTSITESANVCFLLYPSLYDNLPLNRENKINIVNTTEIAAADDFFIIHYTHIIFVCSLQQTRQTMPDGLHSTNCNLYVLTTILSPIVCIYQTNEPH